jgi:hypothetical protein
MKRGDRIHFDLCNFVWILQNMSKVSNEGISAASFCRQVAALVPEMFLQLLFSEKSQNCL